MTTERKTTAQRGYGAAHQALRKRLLAELADFGRVPCTRCGGPIIHADDTRPYPNGHVDACRSATCTGTCWQQPELDHTDDRNGYQGLSHKACNRAAGGGAAAIRAKTPLIFRSW